MTLSDILTLAKQGYKAQDIKDLIALADQKEPEKEPEEKEPEEKEPEEKEPEEKEPEKEPDYKKLYEETEEKLKKAQSDNRRDQSKHTEKTQEEIMLEHFNSILK